jgi:hypothetical protein
VIDQPRYAEWIRLSHKAAKFQPHMVVTIQGLGKFDAKLIAEDRHYLSLPEAERLGIDQSIELSDRFISSYLWVLGTYEVIRSIDQYCRENASLLNVEQASGLRGVKHLFERVRIPLAKFEPARRFSETDSTVAYPSLSREHGIAWQVADNVFTARGELSDCFLKLLRVL